MLILFINMNILNDKLPKDLINIIEEYTKDRTNYDKVKNQFESIVMYFIKQDFCEEDYCSEQDYFEISGCENMSFKVMERKYPECHRKHIACLDKMVKQGRLNFGLLEICRYF